MADGERFSEIHDMLEEGEVPYQSVRIVWLYDENGQGHTRTDISKEANIDMVIGGLEIAKYRLLQKKFGKGE